MRDLSTGVMASMNSLLVLTFCLAFAVPETQGGQIRIYNWNTASYSTTAALYLENTSRGTEGLDNWDSSCPPSPNMNATEIYTYVDGRKLNWDERPVDTSGWDFHMGVKGFITSAPTYMLVTVTDTTDLEDKRIFMYDLSAPDIKYEVPLEGEYPILSGVDEWNVILNGGDPEYCTLRVEREGYYELYTVIDAPNLENQGNGSYADWRLDLVPIPEPSSFVLLVIALLGICLFGRQQITR